MKTVEINGKIIGLSEFVTEKDLQNSIKVGMELIDGGVMVYPGYMMTNDEYKIFHRFTQLVKYAPSDLEPGKFFSKKLKNMIRCDAHSVVIRLFAEFDDLKESKILRRVKEDLLFDEYLKDLIYP